MENKNNNAIRIYAKAVTVCCMIFLTALIAVIHHAGYDERALEIIGLKEPELHTDKAVMGWNNSLEKLNYDADIVFFGDSITHYSDFGKDFPDVRIVNLGLPGDTLSGMIDRIPGVAAVNPEKVFFMGGINGLTDNNIDKSLAAYCELLDKLEKALPNAEIYIESVLPISHDREEMICHNTTIVEFNRRLRDIAGQRGMTYINLHSLYELNGEMDRALTMDGIHLWPEAYDRWADKIAVYIK